LERVGSCNAQILRIISKMLVISPTFICGNCDSLIGKATGYVVTSNLITLLYIRHILDICVGTCIKQEVTFFYKRFNSLLRPSLVTN
jgi:hypothetical protein